MEQAANTDAERKIIAILKVLSESSEPLGSITIARELERHGIFLSERAVRYHLRIADERGYTLPLGRNGRMLTSTGIEELTMALAPEQVGLILEKLELLAFQTTFNPEKQTGQLPINTSLIDQKRFKEALIVMADAFKAGLCVSHMIATVCSAAINGVLLKSGIPVNSKFGGVLEIRDSKPRRFVAVIEYAGTSIDPSEQYIRAGMTSIGEAAKTGRGKILANFREIPAAARTLVNQRIAAMKEAGIEGVYLLGNTSEPTCQIPVGLGRVGIVLLGGLNPVASAVEAGIEVENVGESGVIDYDQLINFEKLL